MEDLVRALGIDYGTVRVGLAASDEIGLLAHPLEAVSPADAPRRIAEIVEQRRIDDIVIGLPLHTDGREGDAVEKARRFANEVKRALDRPVRWHEVDERYTTEDALVKLRQAGRNAKKAKSIIDQAAAVEILQRWLDGNSSLPSGGM